MDADVSPKRSPLAFFLLVFALSLPLYLLSPFVQVPGLPKNGPVLDFVGAFVPAAAALILTYRAEGRPGVRRLLKRTVDLARITRKVWYLPVLLLVPVTVLASYGLLRALGVELPAQPALSVPTMLLFVGVFLVAAAGEELGWTGYVLAPLQERWGALGGALVLGLVWWAWHLPSIVQSGQTPVLIVLGVFAALGWRVIWTWIHNNAGRSVAAIIVVHALTNVGSGFIPSLPTSASGPVNVLIAVTVTLLWGASTLARFRFAARADRPAAQSSRSQVWPTRSAPKL